MVEYKKKKIQLQNGGTRNYYYKIYQDGKKKQVSKEEYTSNKKGGKIDFLLYKEQQKQLLDDINNYLEQREKNLKGNITNYTSYKILSNIQRQKEVSEKYISEFSKGREIIPLKDLDKFLMSDIDKIRMSNQVSYNQVLPKLNQYIGKRFIDSSNVDDLIIPLENLIFKIIEKS